MTDSDRISLIRQRRGDRINMTVIGRELGLSRERIRQICLRNDIPTTDPPEPKPPLICHGCGEPYCHPVPGQEPPYETASQHLRRTGHHPKPRIAPQWHANETQARIIALHLTGRYTNREIATEVGRTIGVVCMTLRRAGLTGGYNIERDSAVIEGWKNGDTYATLQERHGIGYLRIRQIVAGFIATNSMPVAKRQQKG